MVDTSTSSYPRLFSRSFERSIIMDNQVLSVRTSAIDDIANHDPGLLPHLQVSGSDLHYQNKVIKDVHFAGRLTSMSVPERKAHPMTQTSEYSSCFQIPL